MISRHICGVNLKTMAGKLAFSAAHSHDFYHTGALRGSAWVSVVKPHNSKNVHKKKRSNGLKPDVSLHRPPLCSFSSTQMCIDTHTHQKQCRAALALEFQLHAERLPPQLLTRCRAIGASQTVPPDHGAAVLHGQKDHGRTLANLTEGNNLVTWSSPFHRVWLCQCYSSGEVKLLRDLTK